MAVSKIAYLTASVSLKGSKIFLLTYQIFSLGLLRLFPLRFCLYTTEATHPASWHPAISSSVFSILFDFAIFTPSNQNFFSTFVFSEIYYTFCFENLQHVNLQFLIGQKHQFYYMSRKNHD